MPREVSPRMFENPILEWGSRVHPVVPPLLYLPVIGLMFYIAIANHEMATWKLAVGFAGGLAFWTFLEYVLHRFVFHWQPDSGWGRKLHFIIHGVHHDYPHDPMRLVMPPSASIPLALMFLVFFRLLLGPVWCLPAFAGMLIGYLIYDMTHYHVHHHRAKNRLSLALRRYHYRHHFQQSDRGYGVSSPIWDRVFHTSPVVQRRARDPR
jgi:sterol desaturase/sphingolipid hydroxylase (fatty acid hydroxylase superfamily)